MLMEGAEKLKKGGEARQGKVEPSAQGRRAQRRPLACPKPGLWRMGWQTVEGQGECSRPKAPWDPGWTEKESRRRKRG